MALKIGDTAPEFTLIDSEKKQRSLKELIGSKTVLVFYPGAFTGVCTKEMCTLRDSIAAFSALKAQVVGISVDPPYVNKAFGALNKFTFPLLSDYTRETSKIYCGLQPDFSGLPGYFTAKRSVFVLDANKVVKYVWITDNPSIEPPYGEISSALESF